jgi:hypothetical protein
MLPDGELVNLQLQGASLSTWFEFQKNQTHRFFNEFVHVEGYKEGKIGAVTFTYPVFGFGGKLTSAQEKLAEEADDLLSRYEASYFKSESSKRDRIAASIEMLNDTIEVEETGRHSVKQPTPPLAADAKMVREYRDYDPDDLPF